MLLLRMILMVVIAYYAGKLIAKIKLPSILGWLIAGMLLGPNGLALLNDELLNAGWYGIAENIFECGLGLMIGSELVWSKLKKSGKSIVVITLTEAIGTFLVVSLVFGIVFHFTHVPLYLAFVFGGIALATAPAPALSVVKEFKTEGPVTKTLIPMAALDDIIGCIIFFGVIATVAGNLSGEKLKLSSILLVMIIPIVIGIVIGRVTGMLLKKERSSKSTGLIVVGGIVLSSVIGIYLNREVLPVPVINFMLIGMAFSATFSNMISTVRLEKVMKTIRPVIGLSLIIVIINLGAPLDYHLIFSAGLYTCIYILARAVGKYFGAYYGAYVTKAPDTVKKYLGFTLLPHSGVSLVFTGIAASVLQPAAPECAVIVQATITAAAVINEIIAVIVAKKGFEWAGEFGTVPDKQKDAKLSEHTPVVITISRQYGSGGRMIGKMLAEKLDIPFYDHELIEMVAEKSHIDEHFYENMGKTEKDGIIHDLTKNAQWGISMDDLAFLHQSKVIKDVAKSGSCVIVGRCADYVLKERKNVLSVFISADIVSRVNRVEHDYQDVSENFKNAVEQMDKTRSSYYEHYTGQYYGDAKHFDLCLNSSLLGIEACVEIVENINRTMCSSNI